MLNAIRDVRCGRDRRRHIILRWCNVLQQSLQGDRWQMCAAIGRQAAHVTDIAIAHPGYVDLRMGGRDSVGLP